MILSPTIDNLYFYNEKKLLLTAIKIPEKSKVFFKKILGLAGLYIFEIPLYYTVITPFLIFLFYLISSRKNKVQLVVNKFNKLPENEKKELLNELSKMNKVFYIFSKGLRNNSNKLFRTKLLYKSFQKVKNLYINIEQELYFHVKQENEPFNVPESTDKELIEMLSYNRIMPQIN